MTATVPDDEQDDTIPAPPSRNGLRQTGGLHRTNGLTRKTPMVAKPGGGFTRKPPTPGTTAPRAPLSRNTALQQGASRLTPGSALSRGAGLTRTPFQNGTSGTPERHSAPGTPLTRKPLTPRTPGPAAGGDAPSPGRQQRKPLSGTKPLTTRSGGFTKKPPAPRSPGEAPLKRIPQQSKKRQAELPERRRIVAAILAIEPTCLAPGCNNPSQDGHERRTRARGGSTLSVSNVVGVCRLHNGELTDEPAWGYETGLLLHSWDDEPTEPLSWLSDDQKAALARVRDERWSPTSPYEVEAWYQKRRESRPS